MFLRTPLVVVILGLLPSASADIVHLADGGTLAGVVREVGDVTEIRTLDALLLLPRDQVASIESDAALAAEVARAIQRAKRDWPGALRLVDAAIARGDFDDAVALADAALLHADGAAALPPQFDRLPIGGVFPRDPVDAETAARLLELSGDARRPASARLAAARLVDAEGVPVETLLDGLTLPQTGSRVAALDALRQRPADGTIEAVIERMLFDEESSVRQAATGAVAAYQEDGVAYPLVRALATDNPTLRSHAMDAIETLGATRAVGALIRNLQRRVDTGGKTVGNFSNVTHTSYVSDFDVEIAQAAVIGQPIVKVLQSGITHQVAVAGVFGEVGPAERRRIVNLLSTLTGQSFGDDPKRWSEWLQQQTQPQSDR